MDSVSQIFSANMSNNLEASIDQIYEIVRNRKTDADKLLEMDQVIGKLKDAFVQPNALELEQEYRVKLIEIVSFILERGYIKKHLMSDGLIIGCKLTKIYSISDSHQISLINRFHYLFGFFKKNPKNHRYVMNLAKMTEILQNLILNMDCNENVLSSQTSATTIYGICETGFSIQPSAISPRLLKTIMLNWPEKFLHPAEIHGQKKKTTSIIVSGTPNDWHLHMFKKYVSLCLLNYRKLTCDQLEAKRSLEFAFIRALSIETGVAWEALHKFAHDHKKNPIDIVYDYLDRWFNEIENNPNLPIDDIIISCHLLLKMLASHESTRPLVFEQFTEQILPKAIVLFERLAQRHRIVFNPNISSGQVRLLDPCDAMLSRMLYDFVWVESDDPEWQTKMFSFITPELGHKLVAVLVSACCRTISIYRGHQLNQELEPPGEDDETYWGDYHDRAFRIINSQQRASFGFHLKRPEKTFEKLQHDYRRTATAP